MEQEQVLPQLLAAGTNVIHESGGEVRILRRRKEDDSGWWTDEQGRVGISDELFVRYWHVVDETLDADEEIASIGIDFDSLETEDIEAMATLMHDSNEARVAELEAAAGPGQAGSLENAFDALKMLVFLEQIALHLGITDRCVLDFEGRRANMLTAIENKYQEMLKARDAAERQARMSGGPIGNRGGVRMAPGGKLRPIFLDPEAE